MNPLVWLVAGGILGWLANIEMGADRRGSLALNVACGAAGALAGGSLLMLPFESHVMRSGDLSLGALFVAALGALLLLALVNLFRFRGAP